MSRAAPPAAPVPSRSQLAQALVDEVLAQARKRSMQVCVAVVDPGGHLLALHRMDGLPHHLVDIACDKAATAASFGMTTGELATALRRHPKGTYEFFAARPQLVLLDGGAPVMRDGELIAGLGISGGNEAEDQACAQAALRACLPADD